MEAYQEISLGQYTWYWHDAGSDKQTPCSRFPTAIHHELRANGDLIDEGIGLNERKIQWVGEKDWVFTTKFPTPEHFDKFPHVYMAFDGLDTIVTVTLNGRIILTSDNMFVPQKVDIKNVLKPNGDNSLELYFDSAARVAKQREAADGSKWKALRESSRMYVRKAQYHWGWDWGPSLVTCGPWKDIRLELLSTKITDLYAQVEIHRDRGHTTATVRLSAELQDPASGCELSFSIESPKGGEELGFAPTSSATTEANESHYEVARHIDNAKLWWPARHGPQPLYTATVNLVSSGNVIHSKSVRFGLRKVELVQDPLQTDSGTTFYFRINDRPIFCVGTNWVPCHSLPAVIPNELYKKWIDLAVENNNNMIRIWGGGIYEHDFFYDYCDEKGIMLWHDMMFACGIYPMDDFFHTSCSEEITAQVKRLRNHPSITLWNGDNEVYFMLDRQGVPYDATETHDFKIYPQRKLYHETIPNALKPLSPDIPYWPSSPYGGNPPNNPTIGDVHQWNVWHGQQLHYQEYPQLGGRFVSEYGMHGFPNIRVVEHFCPDPALRYPNSKIMDCHNKSSGADTKLGKYLSGNYRVNWNNMEDYIYASQLMQSEALTYANRAWRRNWKGPGKEECAGILIWQLNDIYPVTSWALVDSFFIKKPAFFTTKRDFAPVCIGISRDPVWHFVDENSRHDHPTDIPTFEVYVSSFLQEDSDVELRMRMYDWTTHKEIELGKLSQQKYTLAANQTTELLTVKCPAEVTEDSYIILAATLHDVATGKELSRHFSWPEPYRYLLTAHDTTVDVDVKGDVVELTCGKRPLKGLLAYVDKEDGNEADWTDNMYDLMPGDKVSLPVKGLDGRDVRTRWLYSWEKKGMLS